MILKGFLGHYPKYAAHADTRVAATIPSAAELPPHARYGPSGLSRAIACLLSTFLSDGIESEKTRYSEQGDTAHDVGEVFIKKHFSGTPIDTLGVLDLPTDLDKTHVDDAMLKHMKDYVRYCRKQVEAFLRFPHMIFVEKRVLLRAHPQLYGTSDFLFLYQSEDGFWHLIIVDLKYGQGVKVLTEDNWQLLGYALFAIADFETTSNQLQTMHAQTRTPRAEALIVDVEVHIFQPRAGAPVPPIKFSREELIGEKWDQIKRTVETSEGFFDRWEKAGRPANKADVVTEEEFMLYMRPGSHCKFCRAKSGCRAYIDYSGGGNVVQLLSKIKPKLEELQPAQPVQLTKKGTPKKLPMLSTFVEKNPQAVFATGVLSDEDKAFFALNKTLITKVADVIASGFKSDLKAGAKSEFAYLGESTPYSEWIEDKDFIAQVLLEKFGIRDFFFQTRNNLSISAVEERVGEGIMKQLGLTKVKYETVKLLPAGSAQPPAAPRGFNVRQLLDLKVVEEEAEAEREFEKQNDLVNEN